MIVLGKNEFVCFRIALDNPISFTIVCRLFVSDVTSDTVCIMFRFNMAFLALSLSDAIFIMLINVKMFPPIPAVCLPPPQNNATKKTAEF